MSFHETYEFFAIDRCLTPRAMRALRAISARATITPSRFYNSYDWGGLKADPADLLRRYFDVFVYTEAAGARWGMLRFPTKRIELARWRPFVTMQRRSSMGRGCAALAGHEEFTVLTLAPLEVSANGAGHSRRYDVDEEPDARGSDESGEWSEPGEGDEGARWSVPLALVRADLIAGDLRILYLLWLCDVQGRHRPTTEREPVRPADRPRLTGTAVALAEFLHLDPDLLTIALDATPSPRPRTAGGLLRAAGARAAERRRRAAEGAAAAHATRLRMLEHAQASEWRTIDKRLRSPTIRASTYADVVHRLSALHELSVERGTLAVFHRRLDALLERHPTKLALRRRLRDGKLIGRVNRD